MGKLIVYCIVCGGNPMALPYSIASEEDNKYLESLYILAKSQPEGVDKREGFEFDEFGRVFGNGVGYDCLPYYGENEIGQIIHQGCYDLLHRYFKIRGTRGIEVTNFKLFDYFNILYNYDTCKTNIIHDGSIQVTMGPRVFEPIRKLDWILKCPFSIQAKDIPLMKPSDFKIINSQLPFQTFPSEVLHNIMSKMDIKDLSTLQKVNKSTQLFVKRSLVWHNKCKAKVYFDILPQEQVIEFSNLGLIDWELLVNTHKNVASLRRIGLILDRLYIILPHLESYNQKEHPYDAIERAQLHLHYFDQDHKIRDRHIKSFQKFLIGRIDKIKIQTPS